MSNVKRKVRGYHPLKDQGPDKKFIIGAFDFETAGLGGKLLAATWFIEGMFDPKYISGEPEEIIETLVTVFILNPNVRWYAHNAQYDYRYLIDYLLDTYSDSIEFFMRTESDVFMIKTCDFELVDSFALWPHSLAKFAQTFTPEIPKLEIDIGNFNPADPTHIAYAKRDVEILVKAMSRFDSSIYSLFGVHVAYTLAATAIKAWRSKIEGSFYPPSPIDDYVRSAYFGGAVQGRFGDKLYKNVKTYDINSSYPYVMRAYGVPYGSYTQVNYLDQEHPGIYRVVVSSPKDVSFPILPKRDQKGKTANIIWPRGKFETTVTNMEINFALEHGYKLHEIKEGVIYNETIYPFGDLVTFCEETRKEYRGTPFEQVVKLIQNSVYGKFGTRKERCKIFVPKDDEDYMGATQWGDNEKLWIKKEIDHDILSLPQWAVFITAHARIHLLKTIYALGVENVIYCDTDSITTSATLPAELVGEAYGQFKLEKEWDTFRAIAPKVYVGSLKKGKLSGAVKGIPKSKIGESGYQELYDTGQIEVTLEQLPSFKTFIKGNRQNKTMNRKSTDIVNSNSWKESGGTIKPIEIMEG
jgi:hypothetical protein